MSTDFVIIGGGVAGLTAGAELSGLGRVTVLEAEDATGYHASGRSAALFEARYGSATTIALNEASRDTHRALDVLTPRGLMVVGAADAADAFARDAEAMGLTRLTPAEARALVPILDTGHAVHAAHHEAAWDLDTDAVLQDAARRIRTAGGAVIAKSPVTAIARGDDGWRVTAGGAEHAGRILVNAAGAWADAVAAMAGVAPLGLRPLRRSIARIPAPGGHDVSRWPMVIGAGETWYAKPDAGAWLISPAEEDPVDEPHDAYPDDMALACGIARYQPFVTEQVTRVSHSWAGLRTFAPDRTLVVGPDPATPAFAWCAGQGGYGFQTAPAAAGLLADLLGGRPPALPAGIVAGLVPDRLRT